MNTYIQKSIAKHLIPQVPYSTKPERHDIRLHADGHILEGLELLETYEGERDKRGTLTSIGSVEFRTPKGKKFICRFSEFSFLINSRKAA